MTRELIGGLGALDRDHTYVLYGRRPPGGLALDGRFSWRRVGGPDAVWSPRVAASSGRRCDVFLSPNSYLLSALAPVPTAMVVHDLIPFVDGLPAQGRARRIERLTMRAALSRSAAVVCVSRSTYEDLIARHPRAAAKAVVAPLAAGELFRAGRPASELEEVRRRHRLPATFVLAAGSLEPRKNLARLIEAHAGLRDRLRATHPLVLVGPPGWDNEALLGMVGRHEHVRYLGEVGDEDLAALYSSCTVFCFPSLYEGFGLPVIEAMMAGAATITSATSSLPEVAGDAARYVDPCSVSEIRAALGELLESEGLRQELSARARARAADFSWSETAQRVMCVLEGIARR